MGRKAEITEARVFQAIKDMEESGKIPNAGAIQSHFGTGCAKRYEQLLNEYFAQKEYEAQLAKQRGAVELPAHIREMLNETISKHAGDYRNDFSQAFSEAVNISKQKIDELNILLAQKKTELNAVKRDFFTANDQLDLKCFELKESLARCETQNKRYKAKIKTLIAEKESVFTSIETLKRTIQDDNDMKITIKDFMNKFEEKT
jgi:hypothetical protein